MLSATNYKLSFIRGGIVSIIPPLFTISLALNYILKFLTHYCRINYFTSKLIKHVPAEESLYPPGPSGVTPPAGRS